MSNIPPVIQPKQTKTEKLVESSYILGILSLLGGITALPAIIQSLRVLIRIRKETISKAAFQKTIFSLVFSSCVLGFIGLALVPALYAAQAIAERIVCVNNMKQLTLAIKIYTGDNYDRYPAAQWCDIVLTNGIGTSDYMTNIASSFHCPAAPKDQKCSYAMNHQFIGIKDTDQIAKDTVLLFESDAGWNAVGGPEILAKHHRSELNVALADGRIIQIKAKDIANLRWNPYTNAPAN